MRCAVVLFTRDLRVHNNPALAAAAREAERVLPLFVLDERLTAGVGSKRLAFLYGSLADVSCSLGGLALRRGETVAETVRLAHIRLPEGVDLGRLDDGGTGGETE